MSQDYYGTNEAAEYLGVTVSSLKYHIFESKTLKPQKVGHSFIFTQTQLDEFKASKRSPGRPKKQVE